MMEKREQEGNKRREQEGKKVERKEEMGEVGHWVGGNDKDLEEEKEEDKVEV